MVNDAMSEVEAEVIATGVYVIVVVTIVASAPGLVCVNVIVLSPRSSVTGIDHSPLDGGAGVPS